MSALEERLDKLEENVGAVLSLLEGEPEAEGKPATKGLREVLHTYEQVAADSRPGQSWAPTIFERAEALKGKALHAEDMLGLRATSGGVDGELLKEFQEASDCLYLVNLAFNGPAQKAQGKPGLNMGDSAAYRRFEKAREKVVANAKAFNFTDDPGFMPQSWSDQLVLAIIMQPTLANKVRQFNVPMNDFYLPIGGQPIVPYKGSEGRLDAGIRMTYGKPASANVHFSPEFFGIETAISEKASEASIIPAQSYIMERLAEGCRLAESHILLNGDTTATHMDPGVTHANDVRRMANGLRKYARTNSLTLDIQAGAATFGPDSFQKIAAKLNKRYRVNRGDCVWITTDLVKRQMETLAAFANYQTVFGAGPRLATIPNPDTMWFQGSDLVVDPACSETLNSSGLDTGTYGTPMTQDETPGGNLGSILYLHTGAWAFARSGGIRSGTEWDASTRQYTLTVAEYVDTLPLFSAEAFLAYGYNVPQG